MKNSTEEEDQVDVLLGYLRRPNSRNRAIIELRKCVEAQSRSMTPENFTKLMHDRDRGVVSRLFALTKSPDTEDKLGGLQVGCRAGDPNPKPSHIPRFAGYQRAD